jgi:hypothetical protein
MAIKSDVQPEEVARSLGAELARADGVVRGLWLTIHRGVLIFWVLTEPIAPEAQQHLYQRTAVLYERFPDLEMVVHILNPDSYEDGGTASALPPDAQPILLPAA